MKINKIILFFMGYILFLVKYAFTESTTTAISGTTLDYPTSLYDQSNWPSTCSGKSQSPINFPYSNSTTLNNTKVFEFISQNYTILNRQPLEIYHEEKFYVNASTLGFVIVKKKGVTYKYNATEIIFHYPSEHTINNHNGDLEIHIVHAKDTYNLATLNEITTGKFVDPDIKFNYLIISTLFSSITGAKDNQIIKDFKVDRNGPVVRLNLSPYVPVLGSFYYYEGSKTSPPCNEDVNWVINNKFQIMSHSQMMYFFEWMSGIYGSKGNNRNLQSIVNRTIYYQNYVPIVTGTTTNSGILFYNFLFIILLFIITI